jgi:hypothetical protein
MSLVALTVVAGTSVAGLLMAPFVDADPTEKPIDPEKVQPGVLGLSVFIVMGVAVVLLVMSMRRHLGKVDVGRHEREKLARAAASSPVEPSPTVTKPPAPPTGATTTAAPPQSPPPAPPAGPKAADPKRRPKGKKR